MPPVAVQFTHEEIGVLPGSTAWAAAAVHDDHGPGLPDLPDGRMPANESRRRRRLIRGFALFAMVVGASYLTWRLLFTIEAAAWFVAVPMLVLELHHAFGLGLYTFSLWDVDPPPVPAPVDGTDLAVAVLIPTLDESIEVLLPVIGAAVTLQPEHETWVLDDGNRPDVARLAAALGARYLARETNEHAKAGNLNNALQFVEADVIAVLDADHVAGRDFLRHTLGYFDDPGIAVVQTPQDFYNVDSFEHEARPGRRPRFNEQAVFYRLILPAKNRWNAAFWCGTSALVRVAALRDVGGVATDSVTEDIHTSVRMHKNGWRIMVHNEVLARGLAASDARQYMMQRRRWARGAMQVMRHEKLFSSRRLTLAQKLAYGATLVGWFDVLRSLAFVCLPVLVLFSGALPIAAPIEVFGPAFLGTFLIQFTALRLLARGYYPPRLSVLFETLRMPAVVPAFRALFGSGDKGFQVTPKGRTAGARHRLPVPPLIRALLLASTAAMLWAGLTLAGATPLHYGEPDAMYGTAGFLVVNMALLVAAARRVRAPNFAGERRASVRFPVDMTGALSGVPVRIRDLSLTGARVRFDGEVDAVPKLGQLVRLHIASGDIEMKACVVSAYRSDWTGSDLGLEFSPGQWDRMRDLALMLFHGGSRRPEQEAAETTGDEGRAA